jgi:hypothetical protein
MVFLAGDGETRKEEKKKRRGRRGGGKAPEMLGSSARAGELAGEGVEEPAVV